VAHASQTLIFADITGPLRAGSLIALAACRKQLLIECRAQIRATHSLCQFPDGALSPPER
jgi:hypothetical protein